ncbi:DUF3895 domain-containing protein [Anoxybacillus sp. CHMUD]|nr:DUF3895 domain-containing protein [Anoxybacillus sp. CHMUD]
MLVNLLIYSKIYGDVCKFLDYLAERGMIQFLQKDGVHDRIYGSC